MILIYLDFCNGTQPKKFSTGSILPPKVAVQFLNRFLQVTHKPPIRPYKETLPPFRSLSRNSTGSYELLISPMSKWLKSIIFREAINRFLVVLYKNNTTDIIGHFLSDKNTRINIYK